MLSADGGKCPGPMVALRLGEPGRRTPIRAAASGVVLRVRGAITAHRRGKPRRHRAGATPASHMPDKFQQRPELRPEATLGLDLPIGSPVACDGVPCTWAPPIENRDRAASAATDPRPRPPRFKTGNGALRGRFFRRTGRACPKWYDGNVLGFDCDHSDGASTCHENANAPGGVSAVRWGCLNEARGARLGMPRSRSEL